MAFVNLCGSADRRPITVAMLLIAGLATVAFPGCNKQTENTILKTGVVSDDVPGSASSESSSAAASKNGNRSARSSVTPPAVAPPAVASSDVAPPSVVVGVTNDRFDAAAKPEMQLVDPAKDGWESEAVSDQVSAQLRKIATWLEAGFTESTSAADVIADGFTCTPLRPSDLRAAMATAELEVIRSATVSPNSNSTAAANEVSSSTNTAGEEYTQRNFVAACQQSLPQLGLREMHAHFKVVHVDLFESAAETQVRVHFEGVDDRGRWQQNATWRCRWARQPSRTVETARAAPRLARIELLDFEEVRSPSTTPMFADKTSVLFQATGIYESQILRGLDYWRDRLDWRFGWDVVGAHGLAVGDVNGDGRDDLYMCETGGLPNRLFVQLANGTLQEISAEAGVDFQEPTHSALLVDLDNDGDQDLVLGSGSYLLLMQNEPRNDGQPRFQIVQTVVADAIVRSLAAADFDGNGWLDLYVCNYMPRYTESTVGLGRPLPYHDANNGARNLLLANSGNWVFSDVTDRVGLDVNNRRFSYAASWEDFDNDGDQDLYVANDFGRNNLYRNDEGRFVDIASAAGVEDVAAGMSVSWGDYNRDGRMDLYVGNMFSSAGNRIAYQRRFKEDDSEATRQLYQRHARGNSLFEAGPDGSFRDVSSGAAVTEGLWAWSSIFADLNNDGWQDLVVANGMVTGTAGPGDL